MRDIAAGCGSLGCGSLSLDHALELVVLIALQRPDRLERAAVRWHGHGFTLHGDLTPDLPRPGRTWDLSHRLEVELPMLTLAESRFALAALERLPADPRAGELLRKLLRQASPRTLQRAAGES